MKEKVWIFLLQEMESVALAPIEEPLMTRTDAKDEPVENEANLLPPVFDLGLGEVDLEIRLEEGEEVSAGGPQKRNRLKNLLSKVAENVESLTQKKAASIETASVDIVHETCQNLEHLPESSIIHAKDDIDSHAVRSLWVLTPEKCQKVTLVSVFTARIKI